MMPIVQIRIAKELAEGCVAFRKVTLFAQCSDAIKRPKDSARRVMTMDHKRIAPIAISDPSYLVVVGFAVVFIHGQRMRPSPVPNVGLPISQFMYSKNSVTWKYAPNGVANRRDRSRPAARGEFPKKQQFPHRYLARAADAAGPYRDRMAFLRS